MLKHGLKKPLSILKTFRKIVFLGGASENPFELAVFCIKWNLEQFQVIFEHLSVF